MAKVFVVEDELVLAKNVCDKLRAHGHKAEMRHNCADALAAVASIIPDVILLDIRLPDGDGLELLPKLREEAPSASVIVMTAHGNERIAVDAMKAGAFEYPMLILAVAIAASLAGGGPVSLDALLAAAH